MKFIIFYWNINKYPKKIPAMYKKLKEYYEKARRLLDSGVLATIRNISHSKYE